MVAIFLAKVRRAISGLMLAQQSGVELLKRTPLLEATSEDLPQIVLVVRDLLLLTISVRLAALTH